MDILGDGYGDFSQEPESGSTLQVLGINETPVSVSYFDALDNGLPSIAIAQTTSGGSEVQVYRNEANRAVNLPVTAFSGTNQGGVFYNAQYSTESGTVTSTATPSGARTRPARRSTGATALLDPSGGTLATQSGTVYSDNDLNGIWDRASKGFRASRSSSMPMATEARCRRTVAVTNAQGFYLFSGIPDGHTR